MRLPPHVSSQGPLRPADSALHFSRSRASPRGCSALPLLAATGTEALLLTFARKGAAALTERLDVRVAPSEKAQIRKLAVAAGIPVAELVRRRTLDRPVVPRTDATTIRELRRLGGLLKKVHLDSGGAYSRETAAALRTLHAAIKSLAGSGEGSAP